MSKLPSLLQPPKERRPRGRPPGPGPSPPSVERLEELYQAYRQTPTETHLAQGYGITSRTAKRLVEIGYPALGVLPFQQRYAREMRAMIGRGEEGAGELQERIAKQTNVVREETYRLIVWGLSQEISTLVKDGKLDILSLERLYNVFEKATKLLSFAMGGPESRTETTERRPMTQQDMMAALSLAIGVGGTVPAPKQIEATVDLVPGPGKGKGNGVPAGASKTRGA